MEAEVFAKMLSDTRVTDLKKLHSKYPDVNMTEFVDLLKTYIYTSVPIWDFSGNDIVFMENVTKVRMNTVKELLRSQSIDNKYGVSAMEDEIAATLTIENIDFNRDSVRRILTGYAPINKQENHIFGLKKGLEFIADDKNSISEENIHILYNLSIGQYLDDENKLQENFKYRHDTVFITDQDIVHTGLDYLKLPVYMERFVSFILCESKMDDLIKAAIIHFYFAYFHPYFDGNGRMARMIHMWYLRQQGYTSTLFIPFSGYIERSRNRYYNAFSLCESNTKYSNVLDVTPFLVYFIENIYNKIERYLPKVSTMDVFHEALVSGAITIKEKELWFFVLTAYGNAEFSSKQLERDFSNAAYATIRSFLYKFTDMKLLQSQKYGNRVRYSVL